MDKYWKLILNILMNSHELHNDYPLAPEKPEIGHNMLPKYCSNIGSFNKLVPNLDSKRKYVL